MEAFQVALVVKNLPATAGDVKSHGFHLWVWKIPWRRAWQPTPVFLPGEYHGQRSLVGHGPRGHGESDTTEITEHACIRSEFITEFYFVWILENQIYLPTVVS